jgi:hypothetical protein
MVEVVGGARRDEAANDRRRLLCPHNHRRKDRGGYTGREQGSALNHGISLEMSFMDSPCGPAATGTLAVVQPGKRPDAREFIVTNCMIAACA